MLEDRKDYPNGQGMRVVYTSRRNVVPMDYRSKGCYYGNEGEDTQNRTNGCWL